MCSGESASRKMLIAAGMWMSVDMWIYRYYTCWALFRQEVPLLDLALKIKAQTSPSKIWQFPRQSANMWLISQNNDSNPFTRRAQFHGLDDSRFLYHVQTILFLQIQPLIQEKILYFDYSNLNFL